jgi:predicted GNAT family N-acyltransferase
MELNEINSASPYYEKVLSLRNRILRIPLGLNLADEDLRDEENQMTIMMTRDEQVLACVMLKTIDKDIVKLRQMAVDDAVQGIGVGATLLSYAENFCINNHYGLIELHARKSAIGFYQKSGYVIEGDEFEEVGMPHVKMTKHLRDANKSIQ